MKGFFARVTSCITAIGLLATVLTVPFAQTAFAAHVDEALYTDDTQAVLNQVMYTAGAEKTVKATGGDEDSGDIDMGSSYVELDFSTEYTFNSGNNTYASCNVAWFTSCGAGSFWGDNGTVTTWDLSDNDYSKKYISFDIKASENDQLHVAMLHRPNGTNAGMWPHLPLFGEGGLLEGRADQWTHVVMPVSDFDYFAEFSANRQLVRALGLVLVNTENNGGKPGSYSVALDNVKVFSVDAVTNLKQEGVSNNSITLTWESEDKDCTFEVFRDGESVADNISDSTYTDEGVRGTHSYYVRTHKADGIYVDSVAVRCATEVIEDPDLAVPRITGVSMSNTGFVVRWNTQSSNDGITKFIIYKNGVELDRVSSSQYSYTDTDVQVDVPCVYTVRSATDDDLVSKTSGAYGATLGSEIRRTVSAVYSEGIESGWTLSGGMDSVETAGQGRQSLKLDGDSATFSAQTAVELSDYEDAYLKLLAYSSAPDSLRVSFSSGNSVTPTFAAGKWTTVRVPLGTESALSDMSFEAAGMVYLDEIEICYDKHEVNENFIRSHTFDADDMYYKDIAANPNSFLSNGNKSTTYVNGTYSLSNNGVKGNALRLANGSTFIYSAIPSQEGVGGAYVHGKSGMPDNELTVTEMTFKTEQSGQVAVQMMYYNDENGNTTAGVDLVVFREDGSAAWQNTSNVYTAVPGFTWRPGEWYTLIVAMRMSEGVPTYSAALSGSDGKVISVTNDAGLNGRKWSYTEHNHVAGFDVAFTGAAGTAGNAMLLDNVLVYKNMALAGNNLADGKLTDKIEGLIIEATAWMNPDSCAGVKVVDNSGKEVDVQVGTDATGRNLQVSMPEAEYGKIYRLVWESLAGWFAIGTVPAGEIEFMVVPPVEAELTLSVPAAGDTWLQTVTSSGTLPVGGIQAKASLQNISEKAHSIALVEMSKNGDRMEVANMRQQDLVAQMTAPTELTVTLEPGNGTAVKAMLVEDLLSMEEEENNSIQIEEIDPINQQIHIKGQMPHGMANQVVTCEVLNPGKSPVMVTENSATSVTETYQYIDKAMTGAGGSYSFTLSMRPLEQSDISPAGNTYRVRIGGDNTPMKQTKSFVYYGTSQKENMMDLFYSASSLADFKNKVDVEQFMLIMLGDSIDILNAFSNKDDIIETALKIRGAKTDLTAFLNLLQESVALTALNINKEEAFKNGVLVDSMASFLGFADTSNFATYKKMISDTGLNRIKTLLTNQNFTSAAQAREVFLNQSIICMLRYPVQMGYSHVGDVVKANAAYLKQNGFDVDEYLKLTNTNLVDSATVTAASKDNATLASIAAVFNDMDSDTSDSGTGSGSSNRRPGGSGGGGYGGSEDVYVDAELVDQLKPQSAIGGFLDLDTVPWAKESINALAARGIIEGTAKNIFAPNDNVTREQFAKLVILTLNLLDENAQAPFTDVYTDSWSYLYVASAYQAGIVLGISETEFGAAQQITREDAVVMLDRALAFSGKELVRVEKGQFADQEQISDYALNSVRDLYEYELINGKGDDMFAPKDNMTRAEAAKVLYELLSKVG